MEILSVEDVNKFLPDWVWYLTKEQCNILINGMLLSNEHKMKNTITCKYDTSSIKLADDFQKLCLHAGMSASIKYQKNKSYRLVIFKSKTVADIFCRIKVDDNVC